MGITKSRPFFTRHFLRCFFARSSHAPFSAVDLLGTFFDEIGHMWHFYSLHPGHFLPKKGHV